MNPAALRALRKSIGLTQAEFGEELGLSRVSIGLMERGLVPIDRRTDLAAKYVALGKQRGTPGSF